MKITHTSCFLQEDGTKQFSKNGINDLIEKHKTVLFHNLVIVLGGEELLYSLTQLEPSWASSWEPDLTVTIGHWAVPTRRPL